MKKVRGFELLDDDARKRMEALVAVPEREIDTSDIPEWTSDDYAAAVPFQTLWKPRKEQITARLDSDVILWLKSHGKGYQTLMNRLLRKEMHEEMQGNIKQLVPAPPL
jgi:uncharacterized protein (DUF4415 family)